MVTRHQAVLNNRKPICRHGNCQAERMEKALYCEFHVPMHKNAAAPYQTDIEPIPNYMLTAGNARRVKGRVRT